MSSYKHGYAIRGKQHYLYKMWTWMKSRCYNPNDTAYQNYGARGISICNQWLNNPIAFIEWAKHNGSKESLVLDRKNNDGNYEPSNCRFVTNSESSINQRKRKDNTSGYRGVHYRKEHNHWVARVQVNKKRTELCWTKTPEEAAIIRDRYIIDNGLSHQLAFPALVDGGV